MLLNPLMLMLSSAFDGIGSGDPPTAIEFDYTYGVHACEPFNIHRVRFALWATGCVLLIIVYCFYPSLVSHCYPVALAVAAG